MTDLPKIKQLLKENNLEYQRESFTADNSCLLQFLNYNQEACVDFYDDTIVILIIKGEKTDIYELGPDDTEDMIRILKEELSMPYES